MGEKKSNLGLQSVLLSEERTEVLDYYFGSPLKPPDRTNHTMSKNRNPTQNPRMRLVRLISIISVIFFVVLLGWQLLILTTGSYPEDVFPVVKIFSGTEESIPVAYAWTIRLAIVTAVGLAVSFIGWIAANRRLGK